MRYTKNQEMFNLNDKRQSTDASPETTQMLELSDKGFKATSCKCSVNNEHLKQIENRSKEIEDVKKSQMQILRLKNPITRNKILKLNWWAQ